MNRGRGRRGGRGDPGGGRGPGQRSGGRQTSVNPQEAETRIRQTLNGALLSTEVQTLSEGQLARRPDTGEVIGTRIRLQTNFYPITCNLTTAFHYDVEIQKTQRPQGGEDVTHIDEDPDKLPSKLKISVLRKCAADNRWSPAWAFDGKKNLYSPINIFQREAIKFIVGMTIRGKEVVFEVSLSLVASVEMTNVLRYLQTGDISLPRTVMQVLEVCLKSAVAHQPNTKTLSKSILYNDPRTNHSIFGGLELWQGHSQSVQLRETGLALNIDVAFGAFTKEGHALDVILSLVDKKNVEDLRRVKETDWKRLGREFKGWEITVSHRNGSKPFKVLKFTDHAADRCMFDMQGSQTDVASYWKTAYGPLRYPWLPCMDVSKNRKQNYLPLEVCIICGGQRNKKLTVKQTQDFIRHAAMKPQDRNRTINAALRNANLNQNETVKAFGLHITETPAEAEGRILPQPFLQYKQPACVDPSNRGFWNLENVILLKGSTISSWAIVSFARITPELGTRLEKFMNSFIVMLEKMGVQVPEGLPPLVDAERLDSTTALTNATIEAQNVYSRPADIIMVLLPSKEALLYQEVKGIAQGTLGVMTQCLVTLSAGIVGPEPKGREQYQANLALKMNLKLGGVNCTLFKPLLSMFPALGRHRNCPYIFFGGDVTHPVSHNPSEPSVGAIVASMDDHLGQFAAKPLFLGHRQETMSMKNEVKSLLETYAQKNGQLPESLVFYRDGISDGQFLPVSEYEYNEFRQACRLIKEDYEPSITYIVVKKRHSTRLTPTNNEAADRNGNTLPGTVVDRTITSKLDFDFYLNAHAGIQGTNKPAHYYALKDENRFGSDGLQLMTYWICYLYGRCTRSVSYAPPAYYAHHAALHGKYLLHHSGSDTASSILGGAQDRTEASIHGDLENRMFFI